MSLVGNSSIRRRFLSLLSLPYLVLALIFLGLGAVIFTNIVRITEITCSIPSGDCESRHLEILDQHRGKVSLFLKPANIETELLEDPSLKQVTVTVKLPHQLTAKLEPETKLIPIGFITFDITDFETPTSSTSANPIWQEVSLVSDAVVTNWYRLDSKGRLLPGMETATPVKVVGTSQPEFENLARLYQYYFLAERNNLQIKHLWLSPRHIGFVSAAGATAFFDPETLPETSLATLQQILSTTTIDFTAAAVDLRFKNPVIVSK